MTENNKYCTADSYGEAKDLACSSAVLSEISDDVESDLRVTVFHEIGHAFMEYLNELDDEQIEKYLPEFFDIFYDDNGVDEEDICEDFGFSFDEEHTYSGHEESLLRKLLNKMLADGFKL